MYIYIYRYRYRYVHVCINDLFVNVLCIAHTEGRLAQISRPRSEDRESRRARSSLMCEFIYVYMYMYIYIYIYIYMKGQFNSS